MRLQPANHSANSKVPWVTVGQCNEKARLKVLEHRFAATFRSELSNDPGGRLGQLSVFSTCGELRPSMTIM
jgi:hypothetical protein